MNASTWCIYTFYFCRGSLFFFANFLTVERWRNCYYGNVDLNTFSRIRLERTLPCTYYIRCSDNRSDSVAHFCIRATFTLRAINWSMKCMLVYTPWFFYFTIGFYANAWVSVRANFNFALVRRKSYTVFRKLCQSVHQIRLDSDISLELLLFILCNYSNANSHIINALTSNIYVYKN